MLYNSHGQRKQWRGTAAMAERYGFYTGQVAIPPYLTQADIQQDCQADLIPDLHRRPGRSYYIIPRYAVEDYYRSKRIPERVILEKLRKLKILPQAEKQGIVDQILSRKAANGQQLDLLTLLS